MSKSRSGRSIAILVAFMFAPGLPGAAQPAKSPATKAKPAPKASPAKAGTAKSPKGGMTSLEAYQKTKAVALKWQPDALLTGLTTLGTSPAGLDGRCAEWSIHYSSQAAGKSNLMSVKDATITPFEVQGSSGRVIEVEPDTIMDSAKLMQIAEENGGNAFPGSKISIAVVQNRNGPLWHISYTDAEGNELLHLAIEGNGGKAKQL